MRAGTVADVNEKTAAVLVSDAAQRYGALTGQHIEEWSRFEIVAPDFKSASRVAAQLDWWLHCWSWVEGPADKITINDTWSQKA